MRYKLFLPFLLFYQLLHAQSLTWVKGVSGASTEYAAGVVKDVSGNYYLSGNFQGTVDFDPGSGTTSLTSSGFYDIFVAKYTNAGALVWVFKIGGSGSEVVYGVSIDQNNNILITGSHGAANIDFDPGSSTHTIAFSSSNDIFVAKYDSSGNYKWAFGLGNTGGEDGNSIANDSQNNVYITGRYNSSSLDMDPGSGNASLTNSGTNSWAFVAKYDSSGNYVWAFSIGTSSTDAVGGACIRVDNSGNVIITGSFTGNGIDFDPGSSSHGLTSSYTDVFLAKYDSYGGYLWAVGFGGSNLQSDAGYAVTTDNSNNIYVTGAFSGTNVDFDPGSGTTYVTANSLQDLFLSKFDSGGNFLWGFGIGGSQNSEVGRCLYTDNTNIYLSGTFNSYNVDFDPSSSSYRLGTTNLVDGFIAKYSSAGALSWAFKVGGTGSDGVFGLAQGTSTGIIATGTFANTNCNFNSDSTSSSTLSYGGGTSDIFFALYDGTLLPVTWLYADAQRLTNEKVQVSWACASEMNNAYFTVERSLDAEQWTELQQVPGSGTTSYVTKYSITELNAYGGVLYYRIKQTDYNGQFSYSNIAEVGNDKTDWFAVYPNPAHGTVMLTMNKDAEGGKVCIKDLLGKTVLMLAEYANASIDLKHLPAGTYLLEYTSDGFTVVKKLVLY